MSNAKAQISNQAQNPKDKTEYFWHLSIWISIVIWVLTFVWHLDFDI
jgi:ATP/ADP translocase